MNISSYKQLIFGSYTLLIIALIVGGAIEYLIGYYQPDDCIKNKYRNGATEKNYEDCLKEGVTTKYIGEYLMIAGIILCVLSIIFHYCYMMLLNNIRRYQQYEGILHRNEGTVQRLDSVIAYVILTSYVFISSSFVMTFKR